LKMRTLDVRRAGRALSRDIAGWTAENRGTIVAFDDLLWDAAATLGDTDAADRVRDVARFHALYEFAWGNLPAPPPRLERMLAWQEQVTWLLSHLLVLDEPRPRRRRTGGGQ